MEQVGPILSEALANLRPDSLADILVYTAFVFSFIVLALLPDGNGRSQNLMFGTMALCVLDLLFAQQTLVVGGSSERALFGFAVHVGIFVFPAITVGSVRKGKKKPGPAIMMAVITSIVGAIYLLMTFGLLMSPGAVSSFF
jgi:hypothetical protein